MLLAGAKGVPVRVSLVSCMTQLERTQRSAQRSAFANARSTPTPQQSHKQVVRPRVGARRAAHPWVESAMAE